MRLVPLIIAAIVVLSAPLVYLVVQPLLPVREASLSSGAIDSQARLEIEALRAEIEGLYEQINTLQNQLNTIGAGSGEEQEFGDTRPGSGIAIPQDGPNTIIDAYAQVVLIANRRNVNRGISVATPDFLDGFLGKPRDTLSDECEPMTNPALREMLITENVGPVRVTMLRPALDSLARVLEKVREADPDLYARIDTAGSLCVRRIRGTVGRVSTHAFGLAVDLNIDGKLDTLGDGRTQLGLTLLADFFRAEGWVWGAAFSREDSMHFEVSREMLEQWRAEGKL